MRARPADAEPQPNRAARRASLKSGRPLRLRRVEGGRLLDSKGRVVNDRHNCTNGSFKACMIDGRHGVVLVPHRYIARVVTAITRTPYRSGSHRRAPSHAPHRCRGSRRTAAHSPPGGEEGSGEPEPSGLAPPQTGRRQTAGEAR